MYDVDADLYVPTPILPRTDLFPTPQVYDITDFAKSHPGGTQLLALAVGRDATILFESHHVRPELVAKTLKSLPKVDTDVNLCPDESFPKPLDSPIYRRIQQRVRDEIMAPLEHKNERGD